jgi:small subunit ribosomal protein S1
MADNKETELSPADQTPSDQSESRQPAGGAADSGQAADSQAIDSQAIDSQAADSQAADSANAVQPSDSTTTSESIKQPNESAPVEASVESSVASDPAVEGEKPKVKIGRQEEGPPPKRLHEPQPNIASTPKHAKTPRPITPPSKRDGLDGDLQSEFDDMFGEEGLDDLMSGETAAAGALIELESRVQGTIAKVVGDDVFINLGGPNEGIASAKQFKQPPEIGETVEVVVARYNAEDGYYEVHVPGASVTVSDWADIEEGSVVDARITGSNSGGLECTVNAIRGFIPASQISIYRVENFDEYVDKKLPCVVTEANPNRKNLVLSHRSIMEREQEAQRAELLESLAVGDVREGVVRRIQDFGAFVDIGGVDGLVHISQLSWDRVEHPSDVVQEGQTIEVKVEKIDKETGKIGLSYRSMQEHPWTNVEQDFPAGSIQTGTVSKIAAFGAFVRLGMGVEGLIHVSELAHHRVHRVDTIVQEGQEVEVKVMNVDSEQQRMSLSMKALIQKAEPSKKKAADDEEVLPESRLPKHEGPLKGGTNRPSSGESLGLKW